MTGIIFKLTTAGRAALVNAAHDGTNARRVVSVGITATAFTPSEALAAIPGEIKRITTIAGDVVASDTIHVTIRDDGADSYTVRGLGLYLDNGVLLGTYSQAAVILEKSPASIFLLATDVRVLDGSVDISTLQFGETNFINPPATTERQGVVQLATKAIAEALTDATRALTAASVAGLFAARALVTRKISTGDGLEGGGNLESDRTLSVKFGTDADTVARGNHTHSAVTQAANGLMTAADKQKLDGIAESANNYALPAATSAALGGVKLGHATVQAVAASNPTATTDRTYAVQVNSAGQAVVNVPWANTNTTYGAVTQTVNGLMIAADKKKLDGIDENANNYALPAATSVALGGVKLGHATVQTVAANNATATDARTYPVQANNAGQLVVNVPWANATYGAVTQTVNGLMISADKKKLDGIEESANNYALPAATSVALGGVKLGHATVQTVAASNPTATDDRTYPVQANSAGRLVVNVPWADTNTTYAVVTTTANGLMAAVDKVKLDELEGRDFGISSQEWRETTSTRLRGVPYVADQTFRLRVEVNVGNVTASTAYVTYTINGQAFVGATPPYGANALFVSEILISKGSTFSYQLLGSFNASTLKVREFRRGA